MNDYDRVIEKVIDYALSNSALAAIKTLPAKEADLAELPQWVHPVLKKALRDHGIEKLYSHQMEAVSLINSGFSIVLVTPTASGKTLCYNLPVIDACLKDPSTKALYLFPTKALSQDQRSALGILIEKTGSEIKAYTYDGDTPADARKAIRETGHIVISNPDMLHQAIMPHHTKWTRLFKNLRYVVLDEIHTYRGVFGSHVANLMRRFHRICKFYGSDPVFICCSATIANPCEHAEKLIQRDVKVVDKNGAPSSEKVFVFYNPPIVNKDFGIRQSYITATRKLANILLKHGVSTIIFALSRLNVEILVKYLKDSLDKGIVSSNKIRGYRGGYLPFVRREIETGLRNGEVLGVVSTNALELGIDIGSLNACIIAGYPGTIASTWQQAGRAGRKSGRAIVVLVGRSFPLDQFIMREPEYFFGKSPEHALINPDNLLVLINHIKCAAFELPFRDGEFFGGNDISDLLEYLEQNEVLHHSGKKWHWMNQAYPANEISLRNIAEENFVVFDVENDYKALAKVDFESAPELIHEDAIYMCESKQYWVEKLDYNARKAYVRPTDVDYYTEAIVYTSVRVLDEFLQEAKKNVLKEYGEVHVVKSYAGFKKVRFYTMENLGFGDINLPQHDLHTTAYWITARPECLDVLRYNRIELIDGFLGAAYALHNISTLVLMCDYQDLGRSVGDRYARWFAATDVKGMGVYSPDGKMEMGEIEIMDRFEPTLFLYDNYPGGIGLGEELYQKHNIVMSQAIELIKSCPCKNGCPSCVGPVIDVEANTKKVALDILLMISKE